MKTKNYYYYYYYYLFFLKPCPTFPTLRYLSSTSPMMNNVSLHTIANILPDLCMPL